MKSSVGNRIGAAVSLAFAAILLAGDWQHLGYDAARTRQNSEKFSTSYAQAWTFSNGTGFIASPVAMDGYIAVVDKNGTLTVMNETDGSSVWSASVGGSVTSTPALGMGRVFVPSENGKCYAFRLSDGASVWASPLQTGGANLSSPVYLSGQLHTGVGFPATKVSTINASTGAIVREQSLAQIVYSSPAISGGRLYVGCDSGRYYGLNLADLSAVWPNLDNGGSVLLSSPVVSGDSVYLLPGGTNTKLYRVDTDNTKWATAGINWDVTIPDAPPGGGVILGQSMATSSPMLAGNYVCFVVRFDYFIDTNADTLSDQFVMHEHVVAVDPSAKAIAWQVATGSKTTSNVSLVPALNMCPTPAAVDTSTGVKLIILSSLTPEMQIIEPTTGTNVATHALDGACRASPAAANGHIYVATENGTLYAFQSSSNRAPSAPVAGFSPANNDNTTDSTPTVSWSAGLDADAADTASTLSYIFRYDTDGEVAENSIEVAIAAGTTSYTLPEINPDTRVTYAVRTKDDDGALSPWSSAQQFWVNRNQTPPNAPINLTATPGDAYVDLSWTASTSNDIKDYRLSIKENSGSFGASQSIGNVTSYHANGLNNGSTYTFRLVAEDYDGLLSSAVEATADPAYTVTLDGVPYASLNSAVASANSGSTIVLGPSTFVLAQTLNIKEGVSIKGYSALYTIINGTGLDRVISLTPGSGVTGTISHVTIYGGNIGIDTSNARVIVKNCIIRNNATAGVLVSSGTTSAQVINNTIVKNPLYGVVNDSADLDARNNIIAKNGYGIRATTAFTAEYNDLYGNTIQDSSGFVLGTGNISQSVLFLDEPNNDYRETTGQPSIDAGDPTTPYGNEPSPNGARVNLGAYGNTIYAATSTAQPPTVNPPPADNPPADNPPADNTSNNNGSGDEGGGGGGGGGCYIYGAGQSANGIQMAGIVALFAFVMIVISLTVRNRDVRAK